MDERWQTLHRPVNLQGASMGELQEVQGLLAAMGVRRRRTAVCYSWRSGAGGGLAAEKQVLGLAAGVMLNFFAYVQTASHASACSCNRSQASCLCQ